MVARARDLTERIDAELAAGRDRLLELHSHRRDVSAALVEAARGAILEVTGLPPAPPLDAVEGTTARTGKKRAKSTA